MVRGFQATDVEDFHRYLLAERSFLIGWVVKLLYPLGRIFLSQGSAQRLTQ